VKSSDRLIVAIDVDSLDAARALIDMLSPPRTW
jgi:hypothetical protein